MSFPPDQDLNSALAKARTGVPATVYSCYCAAFTAAVCDLPLDFDARRPADQAAAMALGASHGHTARCAGVNGSLPARADAVRDEVARMIR